MFTVYSPPPAFYLVLCLRHSSVMTSRSFVGKMTHMDLSTNWHFFCKKTFDLLSRLTIIPMLWHANDGVFADCHGNLSVTQVSEPQTDAAATAADNTLADTKDPAKVVLSLIQPNLPVIISLSPAVCSSFTPSVSDCLPSLISIFFLPCASFPTV